MRAAKQLVGPYIIDDLLTVPGTDRGRNSPRLVPAVASGTVVSRAGNAVATQVVLGPCGVHRFFDWRVGTSVRRVTRRRPFLNRYAVS